MYSKEEKADMVECYMENKKSPALALRSYRAKFPQRPVPNIRLFERMYKKFREDKSFDIKKTQAPKRVLTEDIQLNTLLLFQEFDETSTRRAALDLGLGKSTIQRCLRSHGIKPFKFIPVQQLKEQDFDTRMEFIQYMMEKQFRNPGFFQNILWTDEAIFTTAPGIFNRKNKRYYSRKNKRRVIQVRKQGRKSVKVWCGLWRNQILGPIFFDGNLNSAAYLNLLQNDIAELIDDKIPIAYRANLVWQQDGAPYHRSVDIRNYLDDNYVDWIGERGTIAWPARSPDLTPPDYFLWGTLKNMVYEERFETENELKISVTNAVEEL